MLAWHRKLLFLLLLLLPFFTGSTAWAGKNGKRWDKTPDIFNFVDLTGVQLLSSINANSITVSGINTSVSISISNGEYSINGGTYSNASSRVNNGDTVDVRQTSSGQHLTTTSAVLNLNGITDSFDVTTLENTSDSTPETFVLTDQIGVALNSVITSNSITVTGINTATAISVSGGSFSINNGTFSSVSRTVNNGDLIAVRLTASSTYNTTTQTALTIGGVSDTFSITTLDPPIDNTPDAFVFTDQIGITLNSVITSNSITVTGINTTTAISVSGGDFSINNGSFSSVSRTVNNGDLVAIRLTASSAYNTTTQATLTIGGVSDTFSVTTLDTPIDNTPDAFVFTDQIGITLNSVITSNSITVTGINTTTAISVSGGEFSINNGSYSAGSRTVNNGDLVAIRLTASSTYNTTTQATLTIGGVSDTFSITTLDNPIDNNPDAFSFINQTDVETDSVNFSNAITVSGINTPVAITISNGDYAINGGSYTALAGEVSNGNTVTVRQTASPSYLTTTDTLLTIGGVSGSFSTTTITEPNLSFQLPPQPAGDATFTSNHFSGSDNCTQCHNNLTDNQGNDVAIEKDWSATMMANSTRDPFWKAKVRTELNRNPHLADVINDKCSRCHAPMANFEAKKNNEPIEILDNGFLNPSHSRHDDAMNGVSCTLCHQIQDSPKLGTIESFTGKYEIGNNKEIFGPYDNLFPNPMVMNTGFTPKFSLHTKESEMCATCHNVKTPFVDGAGTVLSTTLESEFPEQMPYSEWLHSDYAETNSCQSCHMERANGVPISNRPMWLQGRDDFAVHEFVGANTFMLNMLKNNKQQLGVIANNFDDIIAATNTMIQSSATIEVLSQSLNQGQLDFSLKINSQTGHKLPSAYPSRRVIVHVTVLDSSNNVVFESGKVNDNGSVQGVASDFDALAFEPHYDVINAPDQVQVYEAIMGNSDDEVTYTLLRGATYLKDNRLLPNGFNKATAPDDVAVAGIANNDNNFIGGSDQISYRISGLTGGSYTVKTELVYQTIAYGFVRDLFDDNSAEVNDFKKMYNESSSKTSILTSTDFTVQ